MVCVASWFRMCAIAHHRGSLRAFLRAKQASSAISIKIKVFARGIWMRARAVRASHTSPLVHHHTLARHSSLLRHRYRMPRWLSRSYLARISRGAWRQQIESGIIKKINDISIISIETENKRKEKRRKAGRMTQEEIEMKKYRRK